MPEPVVIPEIPGGWCASLDRLVTFVELVNLNFDIIVETWEEAFSEQLKLPGVPPITLWAPGVSLPAVPGWHRRYRTSAPPEERAWVGNRFPIGLGGLAVDGEYEFPGFAGVTVDPRKVTIPGRDPMTIIMEGVRANYEIIAKKMEERSLEPVINWTATFYDCQAPPTNDVNSNNRDIVDRIPPGGSVDGPPLPGSSVPTFGPGTGGPSSCWEILSGTLEEQGDGTYAVVVSAGDTPSVRLRCDCAAESTGGAYDFGMTYEIKDGAGLGGLGFGCADLVAEAWTADCGSASVVQHSGSSTETPDGSLVTVTWGLPGITVPSGEGVGMQAGHASGVPGAHVLRLKQPFITAASGVTGPVAGAQCTGTGRLHVM